MNEAAADWLRYATGVHPHLRILYGTGKRYHSNVVAHIGAVPGRAQVVEYIDDMPGAMAAADLLICRAGAMTLAEATTVGVPMVIVPSPNVAHDHQMANARALEKAGAAIVIDDAALSGKALGDVVDGLLANPADLRRMAKESAALGDPTAVDRMVDDIEGLLSSSRGSGG